MKWSDEDIEYLRENVDKQTVQAIAAALKRSTRSVNLKIYRLQLPVKRGGINKDFVGKNMLHELISIKISPEYFKPNRRFFNQTGIGQKRFYQLLRGEKQITQKEYIAIAIALNITLQEAFDSRQLQLDFEKECTTK